LSRATLRYRLSRRDPLYDSELRPLDLLDLEPLGAQQLDGFADQVVTLEPDRDRLEHPLDRPNQVPRATDVLEQKHAPARA
jgi:hypothetical protein